jgi:hypothetical protein
MPNKIADHRRRVVYIEEKENWEIIKKVAKFNGIPPSAIIRVATNQMCEKLREHPNTRFIQPIFE